MADQNLFVELDGPTPRAYLAHLKSKLAMVVIQHHRGKEWSTKKLCKRLGATKAETKALLRGYIDQLSTDLLFTWVVNLGYSLEAKFDKTSRRPLSLVVANRNKKA